MKFLEVSTATQRLGVSSQTVYRLGREGKLKIVSIGPRKNFRVKEEDLLRFINKKLKELESMDDF